MMQHQLQEADRKMVVVVVVPLKLMSLVFDHACRAQLLNFWSTCMYV